MSSRPGDWNCRSCNHLNFQRRDSCQRCGDPKSSSGPDFSAFRASSGPDVRPGDWYCALPNCAAHNFASRSTCFKCGAYKDDLPDNRPFGYGNAHAHSFSGLAGGSNRSAWKSGDWICTWSGCNEHNFASRMECFRCSAPRDASTKSPY